MPSIFGSSSPSAPTPPTSRQSIANSRVALGALALASLVFAVYLAETYPKRLPHTEARVYQNVLPYDLYALEPHISAETMDYHYNKHDFGYDKKLQSLVNQTDIANLTLFDILELNSTRSLPAGVYNNAGQLMNHNIFWESMTPAADEQFPRGMSLELRNKIEGDFGSLDAFFSNFTTRSVAWFGSGWTYVALSKISGRIEIINTKNGDYLSPPGDYAALLNLDVWEHAYYIDYRNQRDKYVASFLKVANWAAASAKFQEVTLF
jgi:Fe-Mn family superoxide dismutase